MEMIALDKRTEGKFLQDEESSLAAALMERRQLRFTLLWEEVKTAATVYCGG